MISFSESRAMAGGWQVVCPFIWYFWGARPRKMGAKYNGIAIPFCQRERQKGKTKEPVRLLPLFISASLVSI
jgi:hypothetical protein